MTTSGAYALRAVPAPPAPAPRRFTPADRELVALVAGAKAGDHAAWDRLVRRFDAGLRAIIRSYRLSPADVDDVVQATWLDLLEAIDDLRQAAAVGGWLATTARRRAMRVLQSPLREQLSDDPHLGDGSDTEDPAARLLADERREALTGALATLPDRHRRLMTLLVSEPALEHRQISAALSMPMGSIGPIRARSLARLRRHADLRALHP
jgi:RNA polymerase sigma factor (sigma-70 family)